MKRVLAIFALAFSTLSIGHITAGHGCSLLVGNWRFNEAGGTTLLDSSESGNNGTLGAAPNNPARVPGRFGSGLSFNGHAFAVIRNSPVLELQQLSVEAWVRHKGYPGAAGQPVAYILAKGGAFGCSSSSYALYAGNPDGLAFYVSNRSHYVLSPEPSMPAIWDGNWHHVVGTFDGCAVRLFMDGREVGHGTAAPGPIVYQALRPYELFIGSDDDPARSAACAYPFIGDIDEVKIWSGALSASEIAGL